MTTELSISGSLPSTLHSAALSRLATFTSAGESFALSESAYGRAGAAIDSADLLRASAGSYVRVKALRTCRREGGGGDATEWSVQVNQRPEPPRTAPRARQYGVIEFEVKEGSDPRNTHLFSTHKRGVRFKRGAVVVEIFQLFESPDSPSPLDSSSYAVTANTRFSSAPSRAASGANPQQQQGGPSASSQEVREAALANIEQVAMLLKGLVDLGRID
ncbi:hypothetical protein JCM6882_001070 [Rhodosporidiobolus microsporus]